MPITPPSADSPPPAAITDPPPSPASGRRSSDVTARRSSCSLACALDVVGDRWTLLVVRDLIAGKRRFSDFLRSDERIPTNILADRLKLLEGAGLIERAPDGERSRRLGYRLTSNGRALGRVVDALATWGLQHLPGTTRSIWPGAEVIGDREQVTGDGTEPLSPVTCPL